MPQCTIRNMLKTSGKTETVNKKIEDIKKNQMEILELKNTITQTKTSVDGLTAKCRGQRKESVNLNTEQ